MILLSEDCYIDAVALDEFAGSPRWAELAELPTFMSSENDVPSLELLSRKASSIAASVPAEAVAGPDAQPRDTAANQFDMNEFFDYDSLCSLCDGDGDADASAQVASPVPRAFAQPLYGFRERHAVPPAWAMDRNITLSKLRAAWSSVGQDVDAGRVHDVVLTAASFKLSSLLFGKARETMAPPAADL